MIRYFEDPNSNKFFQLELEDDVLTIASGTIGTPGDVEVIEDYMEREGIPVEVGFRELCDKVSSEGFEEVLHDSLKDHVERGHDFEMVGRVAKFYKDGEYKKYHFKKCLALDCSVSFSPPAAQGDFYSYDLYDIPLIPICGLIMEGEKSEDEQQWIGIDKTQENSPVYHMFSSGGYDEIYGNFDQFLSDLGVPEQLSHEQLLMNYVSEGKSLYGSGRNKEAIEAFDRVLTNIDKKNLNDDSKELVFSGLLFRGLAFEKLGNFNQAVEDMSAAEALGSGIRYDYLEAAYQLACVHHYSLKKSGEALAIAQAALKKNPRERAWYNLHNLAGMVSVLLGKGEDAEAHYRKILEKYGKTDKKKIEECRRDLNDDVIGKAVPTSVLAQEILEWLK